MKYSHRREMLAEIFSSWVFNAPTPRSLDPGPCSFGAEAQLPVALLPSVPCGGMGGGAADALNTHLASDLGGVAWA